MNDPRKLSPALRTALLAGVTGFLFLSPIGCKSNTAQAAGRVGQTSQDPATANLAQPYTGSNGQAQVLGQSQAYSGQSSSESFETQQAAPIIRQAPTGAQATQPVQYYPVPQAQSGQASYQQGNDAQGAPQEGYQQQPGYDPSYEGYDDAAAAGEQALAEADQPPPPLPEYDQPPAPEDDYLWTPGYWDYANTGYYWVPGAWVAPPFYGALWTPPYWAYAGGRYVCHRGYWGPHVGYYGGINYGFGYIGYGYYGGYWSGHDFYYNRAVTNVNVDRIHNVYLRSVVYDGRTYGPRPIDRVSYNGGRGGIDVRPRPQEIAAMHEAHYAPLAVQRENRMSAASNRAQFFQANHGRPAQAYASRPFGAPSGIAAVPRGQAFNHGALSAPGAAGRQGGPGAFNGNRGGAPNQPGSVNGGRPGEFNRPGGVPNQPGLVNGGRPGESNRPGGVPNQPGLVNGGRPGESNRPGGVPNQPGAVNGGRLGEFNRSGGVPNQPGAVNGGHPGEFNRPGGVPNQPGAVNGGRPGEFNRPGGDNGGRAGGDARPAAPAAGQPAGPQPNAPGARAGEMHRNFPSGQPAPGPTPDGRGGFAAQRMQQGQGRPSFQQPQGQAQPRPNFQPQGQPQPQARPNFQQPQGQPQARPNFQQPQGQPQPQARPNFQQQERQAPAFQQRQGGQPQPAARPAPAPRAEAPRGNGGGGGQPHDGGDHGHHQ